MDSISNQIKITFSDCKTVEPHEYDFIFDWSTREDIYNLRSIHFQKKYLKKNHDGKSLEIKLHSNHACYTIRSESQKTLPSAEVHILLLHLVRFSATQTLFQEFIRYETTLLRF